MARRSTCPTRRSASIRPVLSEGAASLLPDGDQARHHLHRPVSSDGGRSLDGAERAIIRSRAKLGYATVRPGRSACRFQRAVPPDRRGRRRTGASRVDPPQQEVIRASDGSFELQFRPVSAAEQAMRALSLAANLAIADLFIATGRASSGSWPSPTIGRSDGFGTALEALGVEWPKPMSLEDRQRSSIPMIRKRAAFMLAIRRAGAHASYAPFRQGERPVALRDAGDLRPRHGAASPPRRPLRLEAALALANGRRCPARAASAFRTLARRHERRTPELGRSTPLFSSSPRRWCFRAAWGDL